MLKKLKRKFLIVTMGLISLVLIVVFASLLISTYTQQISMVNTSLNQALGEGFGMETPKERFGRQDAPVETFMTAISILADEDGNILISNADTVDISDDVLSSAISAAISSGSDSGHLSDLGLYFARTQTSPSLLSAQGDQAERDMQPDTPPDNRALTDIPDTIPDIDELQSTLSGYEQDAVLYKLAFVSDSNMRGSMSSLTIMSLMVGAAALGLLFLISLFLANWALKPVERVWNQQKQFISDASHELKTPLTVILANISILSKHTTETVASQSKWISSTSDEAQRMKGLVDDLLTLARLDEVGQTAPKLQMCDVDLSDVVMGELLTFEPVAFERGVELKSEIAPNVKVHGDADKLRQLTAILLDNACKYAGCGGDVCAELKVHEGRAHLNVTNSGDIIPPEQLSHVFERFYRTDKARTGAKSGFGLGLAIAAGIVRLHGGEISAQSDAQHGTVFSAVLPIK